MFGIKSENGYHEILEGIKIKTIVYGKESLMTEFLLRKNSVLVEHSHKHEQTGYLVKGKIKLIVNGSSRVINPGDSWNIPSDVVHKAEIIEDSIAVEVFIPMRDEYIPYLNKGDILD